MWGKWGSSTTRVQRGAALRLVLEGEQAREKIGDGVEDGVVKYRDRPVVEVQPGYTIGAKKGMPIDKDFLDRPSQLLQHDNRQAQG